MQFTGYDLFQMAPAASNLDSKYQCFCFHKIIELFYFSFTVLGYFLNDVSW